MVLLTVLRKQQLKEKQLRVLVLGLDNAGKSSIVSAALHKSVTEVQPTLGFRIETLRRGDYTLTVWDVGGQKSLRPFWHNYFEKTEFLIWVVDASAPERLDVCRSELHAILTEDQLQGAGLLVWINKLDLIPQDQRGKVISSFTSALRLDQIGNHHYRVLGCSAYDGEGIEQGLEFIIEELEKRLFVL